MLCVLCLIVLWGFSLVSSYSGVNDVTGFIYVAGFIYVTTNFRPHGDRRLLLGPPVPIHHTWAIVPRHIEQFRIVLSTYRVSAPTIQRDRPSMPYVMLLHDTIRSIQHFSMPLWSCKR